MKTLRKVLVWLGAPLIAVAFLWVLCWQALSWGAEFAITAFFDDHRNRGWQAEHGDIEVTGFPMRLDIQIENIALADPQAIWSWSLPSLHVKGRATIPNMIEAQLPEAHRLVLQGESIGIVHQLMATRLAFAPDSTMDLRRGSLGAAGLILTAQSGWKASARALTASLEKVASATGDVSPNAYTVTLSATGVDIPHPSLPSIFPVIDPGGFLKSLSGDIDRIGLEAVAAFRTPLDRFAFRNGGPALDSVTIHNAELVGGGLTVQAHGNIRADAKGYAAGRINVNLHGPPETSERALQPDPFNLLDDIGEVGTGLLSLFAAGDNAQTPDDFILILEGGRIRFGPFDIGKAPRLAPPKN